MLKKIRDTSYPAAFVDWMIGTYGREELMQRERRLRKWLDEMGW